MSALDVIKIDGTTGALSADFKSMKLAAKAYVKKYKGMVIKTNEDRKAAKNIRAELNSKIEALERARIDAFRDYDKPKEVFKAELDEVKDVIREQLAIIDADLKKIDDQFKADRMAVLAAEYEAQAPDLMKVIPLERFIERQKKLMQREWSDSNAAKKLGDMIAQAVRDRESIKAAAPKFATAADQHFCAHLDLSAALAEATRLAAEAEARERHAEQLEQEAADRVARSMAQASAGSAPRAAKAKVSEKARWSFEFLATRAQAMQVAEYARSIGVTSESGIVEVKR